MRLKINLKNTYIVLLYHLNFSDQLFYTKFRMILYCLFINFVRKNLLLFFSSYLLMQEGKQPILWNDSHFQIQTSLLLLKRLSFYLNQQHRLKRIRCISSTFHILQLLKNSYYFLDVMSVKRSEISYVHTFKDILLMT